MNTTLIKRLHRISAIVLFAFILFHLLNHVFAILGPELHIRMMEAGRKIYRFPLFETILMGAILTQILTGIFKLRRAGLRHEALFDRLQVFSGLYLAFFLFAHTTAVWAGRYVFGLDTNFYFGAFAFQAFPWIFVPYYLLSMLAFFTHTACVLRWVFMDKWGKKKVDRMSWIIISGGALIAVWIIFIFMEGVFEINLPTEYSNMNNLE